MIEQYNYDKKRLDEIEAQARVLREQHNASRDALLDELLASRTGFSRREKEVLQQLRSLKSNKEIACALNISVRTAKFHVSRILEKLGVASRYEIMRMVENGQVE